MKDKIYVKLLKCCGGEYERENFIEDLNIVAKCIVQFGKETNKMRKFIHPDLEHIEDIESARLLSLLVFMNRYEPEIKKLMKAVKIHEEDIQEIFEMMP